MSADTTERKENARALVIKIIKLLESENVTLPDARLIAKAAGYVIQDMILTSTENTAIFRPEDMDWYKDVLLPIY